ncbi:MAG TPA: ABC transporter ATP-binding protein [Rhodospirillales bacterium]|jgi:branched-chain amino acid transport system ATP-binding protein|nr:ABC transporter ATP-binding protein [Rhodospirillales bacterium]HIC59859.1 ABC transporter ATP-binding protein [Rhodospirillales bacterium]HIM20217.1 ABC transporter ATP-binding protein [Rhodospirillales bacterium]HIN76524.1 ABC transporter ATP-binding protein [Rhodospirillales bacterium]HIP10656.1 ABC transporter ATP-binding protein [Rhodospirillales bacterium]
MLEIRNLTKMFGGFTALSDVNLSVEPGERLGLIGPNGSGKTTLINCISGSIRDYEGEVQFNGQELNGLAAHQRTRVGICRSFQIPKPFASMTIKENLLVPLEYAVQKGDLGGTSIYEEADNIIDTIGLAEKADQLTSGLTQIEMRKVELARAMAAKPKLLICDEAMAGLSSSEVDDILKILIALNEATKITIIMIEHIMRAVMSFSERVVCLDAGKVIANATPDEVIKTPAVEKAYLGE